MPIASLPPVMQSTDTPKEYEDKGDVWTKALSDIWTPQANALEENVNSKEASTVAAAATATEQAVLAAAQVTIATTQAQSASAIANFKGPWSDLTGSLDFPATTYHVGRNWQLLKNLPDVTAVEPGTDPTSWVVIGDYIIVQDLGTPTGATTISLSSGRIAKTTITGDVQFTFDSAAIEGNADILLLRMTNPGAYTLTWNDVLWNGEIEPSWQNEGVDIAYFIRDDIGGKWRGLKLWSGVIGV